MKIRFNKKVDIFEKSTENFEPDFNCAAFSFGI